MDKPPKASAQESPMDDETPKPKLELVPPTEEELDEEEKEFRALRRDLPGVKVPVLPASLPSPWARRRPRTSSSAVTRSSARSFRWSTARWEWNANTLR